ncbi:hypothetical protein ABH931_001592 [Streptacidiphilus sp. MAP12-33]|uniref:hypothetical protein n=1 Tax=Streptacidiphilus sp. MAP12-33 TaxID=3156266 RepID=UPI003515B1D8
MGDGMIGLLRARLARRAGASRSWLRPVRWIWRLPERGLPDALRLRLLSRWIAWRTAAVLVLLWPLTGASWPVWPALALPLLDLVLWLTVLPEPLRLAVRTAGLGEEIRRMNAHSLPRYALGFDPDRGRNGRIPARDSEPAPTHFGEPLGVFPTRLPPPQAPSDRRPVTPATPWTGNGRAASEVKWTGHSLVLSGATGALVQVNLEQPGHDAGSRLAARPTELVWLKEHRVGEYRDEFSILLLDATGRRLATMAATGFDEQYIRRIAAAARLDWNAYEVALPRELPGRGLVHRMFPPRRGHVWVRGL